MEEISASTSTLASISSKPFSASSSTDESILRENILMQKIFKVTLDKNLAAKTALQLSYLPELEGELGKEGLDLRLNMRITDRLLEHRIRQMARNGNAELSLQYLSDCFYRSNDDALYKKVTMNVKTDVAELQQQIINYSALVLQCPDMFEMNLNDQQLQNMLVSFLEGGIGTGFLTKLVDQIENNDANDTKRIFESVIVALVQKTNNRMLGDLKTGNVNTLRMLLSIKRIANIAASMDVVLPSQFPHRGTMNTNVGFFLQNSTLLGNFLTPTTLDGPITPINQEQNRVAVRYFKNMSITHQQIQANMQILRHEMLQVQDTTNVVVKDLCRSSGDSRNRVLRWYGYILTSNEAKAKISHHSSLNEQPISITPQMEAIMLRMTGENSHGFALNVFWSILQLVEPIKFEKISDLDPFYLLREDNLAEKVLGDLTKEAPLGEEINTARQFYKSTSAYAEEAKFPTQVFWLALKGMRVLFKPAMSELTKILRAMERMSRDGISPKDEQFTKLFAELLCWKAIVYHPRFVQALWHFLHLTLTFLLRLMFCYEKNGETSKSACQILENNKGRITALIATHCPMPGLTNESAPISPQFAVFPAVLIDDIFYTIKQLVQLHRVWLVSKYGWDLDPLASMDSELVIAMCIAVMCSSQHFRNVHTRCDGGSNTIYTLHREDDLQDRVINSTFALQHLIPALANTFIDSQKAGYYDRMNFRLPLVEMFQDILNIEAHRKQFHELTDRKKEVFVHLVHLLLNDLSYLMEEAITSLSEVRRRENEGIMNDDEDANTSEGGEQNSQRRRRALGRNRSRENENGERREREINHNENERNNEEDAGSDTDDVVEALSGQADIRQTDSPTLKQRTQTVVFYGFKSCSLLWTFANYCGGAIINSSSILPQTISCLDCCLFHLVGPRCLQLKVRNMDEYNFKPKEWLSRVCESFIYLMEADTEGDILVREISMEGRYFKPEIFRKAMHIARREGLMRSATLEKFGELLKKLAEFQQEQDDLLASIDDIPDEFLDPIMSEIMTDPVIMPTSNIAIERKNIERHLMSDETDPFNRKPLKKEDLIPATDLKLKIDEFLEAAKAKLREKKS